MTFTKNNTITSCQFAAPQTWTIRAKNGARQEIGRIEGRLTGEGKAAFYAIRTGASGGLHYPTYAKAFKYICAD